MATSPGHDYGVLPTSNLQTYFDIYYQHVRGLGTEAFELLANVNSSNFHVICPTEIWFNDSCSNYSFFEAILTVHRR